ncbi:MAG: A/G-specific adenine glycosylase [Magnetococcales bacterium]|nr:A/G-specific adenine glycosylase [Magnetococcales bacterium]
MIPNSCQSQWPDPQTAQQLAEALLAYYDRQGRSLPWRGEGDLYRIWVSEIMLQQTGVKTVIPYYGRFLERFPSVSALASADLADVLHLWQGLGYYRRARNLHAAALLIRHEQGGQLPQRLEQWQALPGIGPSTAAAILAIGCNQPHAILDGNVKRVLSRYIALREPVESGAGKKILWQMARRLTPSQRPGDYAQAIMDLGATLCTRTKPDCPRCPWQSGCRACQLGEQAQFPVKKGRKKAKPHQFQIATLIQDKEGRLLVCLRPETGLLAGLWEPPGQQLDPTTKPPSLDQVSKQLKAWGISGEKSEFAGVINHTFTHFHLTVYTYRVAYQGGCLTGYKAQEYGWLTEDEIQQLPRSTLHKKIMALGWESGPG